MAFPAAAQTPSATVTNEFGDVVLQSNRDGGLLAPGEFSIGTIPAEGAGTRLMWHPEQAAFRVGEVQNDQWNAVNIGDYSVAFGLNTEASDALSTAMGEGTTASGDRSTAMGFQTIASEGASTAMGSETTASGFASTEWAARQPPAAEQP